MELLALSNQIHNNIINLFLLGVPFKRNFMSVAKTILKRLFRVYAHIYHQHFDSVIQLQEEAHLNTSFKHFIFFVQVQQSLSFVDLCLLSALLMYWFFLCGFFSRSSTWLTGKNWSHFRSWLKNWQPRIDKQMHNPYFNQSSSFCTDAHPTLAVCMQYIIYFHLGKCF